MLAEKDVPKLTKESIALLDKELLAGMLATKTEHLLISSRCNLADFGLKLLREEVQLSQAEMQKRASHKQAHF